MSTGSLGQLTRVFGLLLSLVVLSLVGGAVAPDVGLASRPRRRR